MTKGTQSFGGRHNKTHTICRRCGKKSWHIQDSQCGACGAGLYAGIRRYNWGKKAIRRKTTGSGRTEHLKKVHEQYAGIQKTNNTYKVAVARAAKKNAKKLN